ncbi:MAG: xanthine dehydrogenase family protein molybdopterin-binding subunit [Rhodospirillales bacterium]|nr:xanthine dehydrogenase family protein molybdopterin-binding subunit [Rhodospirillales bacterium]
MGCEKAEDIEQGLAVSNKDYSANVWVNISADGKIRIYSAADEMGQGSMTALPLIFAEELDAAWEDVEIEFSPVNDEIYGNPKFMGAIYTASSMSVTGYYDKLRIYGAQARRVLLDNVAEKWQVPVSELATEPSLVIHKKSGQSISYGDIASFASVPEKQPEITPHDLKSPSEFRLIGHSVPRRDVADKVLGTSPYSINEDPPGLVYGVAVRSPVMGAKVVKVDDVAAREVKGVKDVFVRENSVVVIADNYHSAVQGRVKLKIEWSRVGDVNDFDSDKAMQEHMALANKLDHEGYVWNQHGDVHSELNKSDKVITREYQSDYVYHAQMEVLNATVWVKEGGTQVEAWVGTQAPSVTLRAVARATGIPIENITVHRSMLGGGFGRRSVYEMDFVDDAAWLSRQLEKPVKIIWTREDDLAAGWFKPMSAHLLRATINSETRVSAWHHRVAVQEPLATAETIIYEAIDRRPVVSMAGTEHHIYDFPKQLAEHMETRPGIRTYSVLGVGWTPNKFAVEGFMNELANEQGVDPVKFRLQHLQHSARGQEVLNTVAEMADWGKARAKGREVGVAFAEYHGTLIAGAAEISITDYQIKVHEFWVAVDPGVVVQPDNTRDQIIGSVVFGLGNALTERITFKNGLVQQSNYHDYVIPGISDVPNIHVETLANGDTPTGVGQTGAVLVAPAIACAFNRLTGKHLRHMPFITERVQSALAS